MNKIKILCALLLILTLSACGGGGSSASNNGGGPAVPIDLSEAPNPGSREPVTASTLARVEAALNEVETAISSLPARRDNSATATLNGYIRVAGRDTDEIILGNLLITANFDNEMGGTVSASAGDFSAFDFSEPDNPEPVTEGAVLSLDTSEGNLLAGGGSITGTRFTSTLKGHISSQDGSFFIVNANLGGGFYQKNGRLVTYGTVSPDADNDANAFTSGTFAASTSE